MSGAEFDWFGGEDVAVREQAAIAVYQNVRGDIAIRQRGDFNPDTLDIEDVVIVVTPRHAAELARAILDLAEPEQAPAPLALAAPPDRTAAARQRRYRNAKRNGSTVTPAVTIPDRNGACDRDTVTDAVTTDSDGEGRPDLFVGAPARGGGR